MVARKHLVDTVTALTSASANPKANLKDGQQIQVAGYYAAGDKEVVTYVWSATSTATADGGATLAHDDGGDGRFLLLKSVCDVADWGANHLDGASSSGNVAAIQAAINHMAGRGGGTVYVSARYALSGGIELKKNVTLQGNHSKKPFAYGDNGPGLRFHTGGYVPIKIGLANSAPSAGIVGLQISCTPGWASPYPCIQVNSQSAIIEDTTISTPQGIGIEVNYSICAMKNTYVYNPLQHGIVFNAGDCKVYNCEVQQPGTGNTAGTYDCILQNAGPLQMSMCRMGDDTYNNRHGLNITSGTATVIGCDFQNNTMAGLRIAGGNGHNIVGNNLISASANSNKCGIRFDSDGLNTLVTSNTFNGMTTVGLAGIYVAVALSSVRILGNAGIGNWAPPSAFISFIDATARTSTTNSVIENGNYPSIQQGYTLTGATPSIKWGAGADVYWLNNAGATSVTELLDGYRGQQVTLMAVNGNTTLKHAAAGASSMRLLNGLDWTMPIYSGIVLKKASGDYTYGPVWYEIARFNGATGMSVGGQVVDFVRAGSPEGAVTAPVGSLCRRTDAPAARQAIYIKESGAGNTGWVAASTSAVMSAIADLDQTISDPPTQGEVQDLSDKLDALLAALRSSGRLAAS